MAKSKIIKEDKSNQKTCKNCSHAVKDNSYKDINDNNILCTCKFSAHKKLLNHETCIHNKPNEN